MKISQLSDATGIPLATIKMYLREGLLPQGEKSSPNQADYGDEHLRRLKLVHGLLRVGGLSVAAAREVVAAVESDRFLVDIFGVAQRAASSSVDADNVTPEAIAVVQTITAGWHTDPRGPGQMLAAASIAAFEASGQRNAVRWYERYAEAARLIAEADLDLLDTRQTRAEKAETVVLGTVLGDTLLAGLRRSAQEDLSSSRYISPSGEDQPSPDPSAKETHS
ncbi:MerR family transcriptional regulator [Microbacterium sp. DT81.1]|uniref:MerR family transcriptional regulator n=1 Tax=Microbacterium sp. DT81.1 TaxID=3393413 RepID=UPI003CEC7F23